MQNYILHHGAIRLKYIALLYTLVVETQTCFNETSNAPTDKVVVYGAGTTLEKRDESWHGPYDMSDEEIETAVENGVLKRMGKLTDSQFRQVVNSAK